MATGYEAKVSGGYVDAEAVFEIYRPGDQTQPPVVYADAQGRDTSTLFTHVNQGTALSYIFGYANAAGVDFSQLYAAKNSVPRYPVPLPWSRTVNPTVTVYRQPSRPTLQSYITLSMSIRRDGLVAITQTTSPYNSNPSTPVVTEIYTGTMPPLWTDAGAAPNSPYEVRFDLVSGDAPSFGTGGSLGQWLTMNTTPFVQHVATTLVYTHNTVEGTKTLNSQLRVSVRRSEYPVSNQANAVLTHDFDLVVEPSAFLPANWDALNTYSVINDAATNYHRPEGAQNTHRAAVRFSLDTNKNFIAETSVWKDAETPTWVAIQSGQWLRDSFSLADFEALFTIAAGAFNPNDTSIVTGSYLGLGGVVRTFTIRRDVVDNEAVGTYSDDLTMDVRIRQISTKGWAGLPDNFAETSLRLVPSVVIAPPLLPVWVNPYAIEASRNHIVNVTRRPEDGTPVAAGVVVRFYPDGNMIVLNQEGTTLSTTRWAPNAWDPSWFELRLSGALNTNPFASWGSPGSPYSEVQYTGIGYDHSTVEGTFTDDGSMTLEIRRKAWVAHNDSGSGTSRSQIVVAAPVVPAWVDPYIWETARSHVVTVTRVPEGAADVSASIVLRVYPDGTAAMINGVGTIIASGRWSPSGWAPSWFQIVFSGNLNSNPLNVYGFPGSPYTEIAMCGITYSHTQSEGTYEDVAPINSTVRRVAYPAHNDSGGGTSVARVVVNPPVQPSWPSLAGLAGSFNETKLVNHTPEGGGSVTTADISVVAHTNGTVMVYNSVGTVLGTVNFLPASLTISQVEVRVVSAGAISNSLSDWTTLSASTGAVISRQSVNSDSAVQNYTDSEGFTFEVRRKAYPSHFNSGSGNTTSTVAIAAPVAPTWPSLATLNGPFTESKTAANTPEGGGITVVSQIRVVVGSDGGVTVQNSGGSVLASATWKPAAFTNAQMEVRIVSAGAYSNGLANWTTLTAGVAEAIITRSAVNTDSAANTYSQANAFTLEIRRKAYTAHGNSVSANTTSTVIISAPVQPSWPSLAGITGTWIAAASAQQSAAPGSNVSSAVELLINSNGTVQVRTNGSVVASATFIPSGWDYNDVEVTVVSFSAVSNPVASWTTLSPGVTTVVVSAITVNTTAGAGVYEYESNFSFQVRRKAFISHNTSGAANTISRVSITAQPNTIVPPTDYDNWAGTYTTTVTGAI